MTRTHDERHGHGPPRERDEGSGEGRRVPYSHEQQLACPIGEDKGKEHVFDDPGNVRWVLRLLYLVCGGLFVVDFFFHRHSVHPLEHWWGFYPLYGFVSCVVLVLAAKEMRKVLMRDRDYYDEAE